MALLEALLRSGRNNGSWDGLGLNSSRAAAAPGQTSRLALLLNDPGHGRPLHSRFAGQAVDANDLLIQCTFHGDSDFN